MVNSLLDNDLYKFTIMESVAWQYPSADAEYQFINRDNTPFPDGFGEKLKSKVSKMGYYRRLDDDEYKFLKERCYYFKRPFLDMLRGYRFDSSQVDICQTGGKLSVTIKGPWYLVVLYEVPLLALISELYYEMKGLRPNKSRDEYWYDRLKEKIRQFEKNGLVVSEFGTRRRFSFDVHNTVVRTMKNSSMKFAGTSNVYLAKKYDCTPIGTMAHEWPQAHAAMFGYRRANVEMLSAWVKEYKGNLGIALPDTFTTDVFLRDFDTQFSKLFDGVRHDSGNWKDFTDKIIKHYQALKINPATKTIVFSDSLDTAKAIEIHKYCEGKIIPCFGIGTHLTNHVGHKPLNIVIKLMKLNGIPTVKLSDSPGKATGTNEEIAHCKRELGLNHSKI